MKKQRFLSIPILSLSLFFLIPNSLYASCVNWEEVLVNLTLRNELEVTWRVQELLGTEVYKIERSIDNVTFISIGEISGLQLVEGNIKYSWNDKNPLFGKVYYRLRQVRVNGEECVSPVLDFTFIDNGIQQAEMYPNPCTEYLHLSFYASKYSELSLVFANEIGVLVRVEVVKVNLGFNSLIVSVSDMAPGLYTVDLKNKELAVRRRLFIQPY
jgi:hypothetical protein